jgi:hypothetical protein
MRCVCLILKCACALALTVGVCFTSAYAAVVRLGPDYICWANSAGFACTDLASTQCGTQGGGTCTYCAANGGLFNKTCLACTNCNGCNNTQTSMNCGARSSGNCVFQGGSWICTGLVPNGNCDAVYQCQ